MSPTNDEEAINWKRLCLINESWGRGEEIRPEDQAYTQKVRMGSLGMKPRESTGLIPSRI